ncbi:MAG: hypothetical protein FWE37_04920 [Spirochaetaceae bacterium]|nr:hypothetical protein [Spirochaetaceae bacterium]
MKKWSKFLVLLLAIFALAACGGGKSSGDNTDITPPVSGTWWENADFTNHSSANAIRFRNDTDEDVWVFINSVAQNNLIGGVRAGDQNAGLIANLPTNPSAFPLVFVTRGQLQENGSNLAAINARPFGRVHGFFNPNSDPTAPREVYTISGHLGGSHRLMITDPDSRNVEVRVGGRGGPTLGYLSSNMNSVTLHVEPGDYDLFPVIRIFNSVLGRLNTIHPISPITGNSLFQSINISNANNLYTFDARNLLALMDDSNITSGVAWLYINNTSAGAVQIIDGQQVVIDSVGNRLINANQTRTFHVDMTSGAGGNDFLPSRAVTYRIGPTGQEVPIEFIDATGLTHLEGTPIPLDRDYMYTVRVTGNHNLGTLRAVIDLREIPARRITLADLQQ